MELAYVFKPTQSLYSAFEEVVGTFNDRAALPNLLNQLPMDCLLRIPVGVDSMVICPDCGLSYMPTISRDAKNHRSYHDKKMNGPAYKRLASDQAIWEEIGARLVVVTPKSPFVQRKRAERVSLVAASDARFSFVSCCAQKRPDELDLHMFLLFKNKRAIAFAKLEKCFYKRFLTWHQYDNDYEIPWVAANPPIWAVTYVWVCRNRLRQGWARQLISEACRFLGLTEMNVGWVCPLTESGNLLVRNLCPDGLINATG